MSVRLWPLTAAIWCMVIAVGLIAARGFTTVTGLYLFVALLCTAMAVRDRRRHGASGEPADTD